MDYRHKNKLWTQMHFKIFFKKSDKKPNPAATMWLNLYKSSKDDLTNYSVAQIADTYIIKFCELVDFDLKLFTPFPYQLAVFFDAY